MGLYDEVLISKAYCTICGVVLEDCLWQTKDGQSFMITYSSLAAFFDDNPDLFMADFLVSCSSCGHLVFLETDRLENLKL